MPPRTLYNSHYFLCHPFSLICFHFVFSFHAIPCFRFSRLLSFFCHFIFWPWPIRHKISLPMVVDLLLGAFCSRSNTHPYTISTFKCATVGRSLIQCVYDVTVRGGRAGCLCWVGCMRFWGWHVAEGIDAPVAYGDLHPQAVFPDTYSPFVRCLKEED